MHDNFAAAGDEEWVIWNGANGLVTTVSIGTVEVDGDGRSAWLDEPFDMVGPFSLDELEVSGHIRFAACRVMSRERWQQDQHALRRESLKVRRAAEARVKERFARFSSDESGHKRHPYQRKQANEQRHREILKLPIDGKLEPRQIKAAFRRLAQKAHPDAGGSNEQFVRITQARNALLANAF